MQAKHLSLCFRFFLIFFCTTAFLATNSWAESEGDTIYGCYKKINGQLRIVSDWSECNKSELTISWPANSSQDLLCDEQKIINVDCSIGETISEALKSVCPGDTILVTGDCSESVVLTSPNHDRIVIDGQGSASINGDTGDAIKIDGAKGVVINRFPSLSGYYGIYALRGAAFEASDIGIQNAGYRGVQVHENSTAQINNLTVENSDQDGIQVGYGSSAILSGTIKCNNNGRWGISAIANSNINMFSANIEVKKNGGNGLDARIESSVLLWDTTLSSEENNENGMAFNEGSTLALYGGANTLVVKGNDKRGGYIRGGSNAIFVGDVTIQDNKWYGMEIDVNSSGALDGQMEIVDNVESGLKIARSSAFTVWEDAHLTVRGTKNAAWGEYSCGVEARDTSVFRVSGTLLVEENIDRGIRIHRSSTMSLNNYPGTLGAQILKNGGYGIDADYLSSIRLGDGVLIEENINGGITLRNNAILGGDDIIVRSNGNSGIKADLGSSIELNNSIIEGNAGNDVSLIFGSRSRIYGGSVGTISCDGTILSEGDHRCP